MNSNKCRHGFDVDANGNHIIPNLPPTPTQQEKKQEQEQWLNRKAKELELEEANRKKKEGTVQQLAKLLQDY